MHSTNALEPPRRILYVDDDDLNRRFVERLLSRSGYTVDVAMDGIDAWEALRGGTYALLITDQEMPKQTGLELVAQARSAGMRLPIVLVTGSVNVLSDPRAEQLGLVARFLRPFDIPVFLAVVAQALE